MPRNTKKTDPAPPKAPRDDGDLDAKLDEALIDTFPASDPVSLSNPTKPGRPNHGAGQKSGASPPVPARRGK